MCVKIYDFLHQIGGGGGCICMRVCIGVGGMEARVIARLSVSESKREFPYNIF